MGGLKDFVEPGVNGLRVPPKDSVALANALTALVSDGGLRARLSEGARRTAVRYDIPHVLGQFAALIDTVAGGATSKPGLAGRQELGT